MSSLGRFHGAGWWRAGASRATPALLLLVPVITCHAAAVPGEEAAAAPRGPASPAWGSRHVVEAASHEAGDATSLGAPLVVDGELTGNATALAGDVIVHGRVHGDVLAILGRVLVDGPSAQVDGSAFAVAGGVEAREGGRIGGDTRVIAGLAPGSRPSYVSVAFGGAGMVLRLLAVVALLSGALAVIALAPDLIGRTSATLAHQPVRAVVAGMLAIVLLSLAGIASVALVRVFLGLPMLFGLAVALLALLLGGMTAALHVVGGRACRLLGAAGATGPLRILAGALVVGALFFVPIVGDALWLLLASAGIGSLLASRSQRRLQPA